MVSAYLTLTFIIKSEDKVVVPDIVGKDVVLILEMLSDLGLITMVVLKRQLEKLNTIVILD